MTAGRVEAMRALCADLDHSIQVARENRAPIRVLALIELAALRWLTLRPPIDPHE
jgi:hypothetical protein